MMKEEDKKTKQIYHKTTSLTPTTTKTNGVMCVLNNSISFFFCMQPILLRKVLQDKSLVPYTTNKLYWVQIDSFHMIVHLTSTFCKG